MTFNELFNFPSCILRRRGVDEDVARTTFNAAEICPRELMDGRCPGSGWCEQLTNKTGFASCSPQLDPHSGRIIFHPPTVCVSVLAVMFLHAVGMMIMMMMAPRNKRLFIFSKGNYINNFVLIICRLYHFSCSFSLSRFAVRFHIFIAFMMELHAIVNCALPIRTLSDG